MDERSYRGGSHPPYCTCVECGTNRRRRSVTDVRGVSERLAAWLRSLLIRLWPRRS